MTGCARRLITRRRTLVVGAMTLLAVAIVAGFGLRTARVERARQRLADPSVTLLRWVPVVGRSVDAERAVTRAAGSSLAGVRALIDAAPGLRTEGGVDLVRMRALAVQLAPLAARARVDLVALQRLRLDWTPGRVGAAVVEVDEALSPVVDGLEQATPGIELALGMLGAQGDRELLVTLGNNAELRGTGGFVSTFATGKVQAGTLVLDPFRDIRDVSDPPQAARPVLAPPEYVQDFGRYRADTTLWLEWNMSPGVPDAASVAATVAGELLGVTPDLVLVMDVPALTRIIGLTGQEVRLPDGSTVSGDQLTEALLVDTYAAAGGDVEEQIARRANLREAAGDAAATLLTADAQPLLLLREIGQLAAGRHLAVWSADSEEQRELERLGLAGSADPAGGDLALISLNNLNATKLDYYLQRTVVIKATIGLDRADVVQRVKLHNIAPDGLVPYVEGTSEPGTMVERVEFSLSPAAKLNSFMRDGATAGAEFQTGNERARLQTILKLPRGAFTEFELQYTVPVIDGRYRLRLMPQPLARDADLSLTVRPAPGLSMHHVDGRSVQGAVTRSGPWSQTEAVDVVVR